MERLRKSIERPVERMRHNFKVKRNSSEPQEGKGNRERRKKRQNERAKRQGSECIFQVAFR